jgi:hypothetical protein
LWVAWLFSSFPPLNRRRHLHFSWCNSSMPKHGPFPRKWLAVSSHLYAIQLLFNQAQSMWYTRGVFTVEKEIESICLRGCDCG